ncbi:MAG TPA: helix-turn-helix transcriptional regulator [Candidatus Paceibacterota bacterium]
MPRRRNQPKLHELGPIPRFINTILEEKGVTQAELANRLGDTSTATLSRWCRGDLVPNEADLDAISNALKLPPSNFKALRLIENTGVGRPMLATAGAAGYLAEGAESYFVLAGLSMIAGAVHLREVNLSGKTLLVQLINPLCKEAEPLDIIYSWLDTFSIIKKGVLSGKIGRVRLWTRDTALVDRAREIGQIAGNDWLMLESGLPGSKVPFNIRMRGDNEWQSVIEPFVRHLSEDSESPNEKLLWDSTWQDDAKINYLESELLSKLRDIADKSLSTLSQDKR